MAKNFKLDSFWMAKIKNQFYMLFDRNLNEVVGKKDFDLAFQDLVLRRDWKDGSPMWKRANVMKSNLWENLTSDADKNNQISLVEWCNFWADFAANYEKKNDIPLWFREYIDITFHIIDKNGDGLIDEVEFVGFYYESRHISNTFLCFVESAYRKIIMNGQRVLDIALFREMILGFTVSRDMETIGNTFGEMIVKQLVSRAEFKRTDIWEKKNKYQFYTWFDQDKNGVVSKNDFEIHVKNILTMTKWTEGSPMWVRLNDVFSNMWKAMKDIADTNLDDTVTIDEWLNALEKMCRQIQTKPLQIPRWYLRLMDVYFDVFDRLGNSDGWVEKEEWVTYFGKYLELPQERSEKYFKKMTYDGRITVDRDFWYLWVIQMNMSDDVNSPGDIFIRMCTEKQN
ncbi:unnamed protein product [Owenia fusiformis]|uniref:EF-hand domain-containing protein n=1 Tax=Owenia fusiformis TaxID=6347 RepID=A0A8S4PK12_OWEFU|nr:unnamed protein product [Owenia fusiformis]